MHQRNAMENAMNMQDAMRERNEWAQLANAMNMKNAMHECNTHMNVMSELNGSNYSNEQCINVCIIQHKMQIHHKRNKEVTYKELRGSPSRAEVPPALKAPEGRAPKIDFFF